MKHATTGMKIKRIILTQRRLQKANQKATYCMIPFIWLPAWAMKEWETKEKAFSVFIQPSPEERHTR